MYMRILTFTHKHTHQKTYIMQRFVNLKMKTQSMGRLPGIKHPVEKLMSRSVDLEMMRVFLKVQKPQDTVVLEDG